MAKWSVNRGEDCLSKSYSLLSCIRNIGQISLSSVSLQIVQVFSCSWNLRLKNLIGLSYLLPHRILHSLLILVFIDCVPLKSSLLPYLLPVIFKILQLEQAILFLK